MDLLVLALAALGIGLALAGAPGPAQALLLNEAARGGVPRGLQVWAGIAATFGAVLFVLALGLSLATPAPELIRALKAVGGVFLLILAVDGFRSATRDETLRPSRAGAPPFVLGSLAVLLNPGGWLFSATVAGPLLRSAASTSGTLGALVCALALLCGSGAGDVCVVMVGGVGMRRSTSGLQVRLRRAFACLLGGFAVWLLGSSALS